MTTNSKSLYTVGHQTMFDQNFQLKFDEIKRYTLGTRDEPLRTPAWEAITNTNVVFPAQVEYSYFSAVFGLKIFLRLFAVLFISFVLYLRYKSCAIHQTVISIEHLIIASAEFFQFFFLGLPFRERNNSHTVKLKTYNCTTPCIVFTQHTKFYLFNINQSQPWVYSSNILKISQISASIFLKHTFLKEKRVY